MGTPYAAADDIMAKIRAVDENVQTTFRKIDKDGNGKAAHTRTHSQTGPCILFHGSASTDFG